MKKHKLPLKFFAPQYWGTWIALALLRFFSTFPYSWLLRFSNISGNLLLRFAHRRRLVIETNINLCFPEKTAEERQQLVRQAFISTFMAIFEIAISWWGKKELIKKLHTLDGIEHLHQGAQDRPDCQQNAGDFPL